MYKSKVNIMANKDLFKQAIADAKSIREAAIANAKLALEESLTPQLKELLAQRLTEMEEEDAPATVISEEEVAEEVQEETLEEAIGSDGLEPVAEAEEEHSEEGEVEGDEAGEEAEVDSEESEDEAEEEVGEMSVEDLKDLIRDVLMQVMGDQEQGEEDELEADAMDMTGDDMTAVTNTEIDIDELMAELATLGSVGETINQVEPESDQPHGNLEEVEEAVDPLIEEAIAELKRHMKPPTMEGIREYAEAKGMDVHQILKKMAEYGHIKEVKKVADLLIAAEALGQAANHRVLERLTTTPTTPVMEAGGGFEQAAQDLIIFMNQLPRLAAMNPEAAIATAAATVPSLVAAIGGAKVLIGGVQALVKKIKGGATDAATAGEEAPTPDELSEALSIIETLRNDLNETNLLNAKLLYVNKVFKASNLSESQKASVIAAFDKAETVKEVKLVYETVSENVSSVGKKEVVREAKGFASAAAGISTKPGVITETNQAVLRMQKLAGIIK